MASEGTDTTHAGTDEADDIEQLVRDLLTAEGLLTDDPLTLSPDADLRQAGLTSLRMVQLVMAIEERCGRTIPDESLSRSRFATISAVTELVRELLATPTAGPPAPPA